MKNYGIFKDRLLRKRYLELAPKRSSSRITKVQEKKRQEVSLSWFEMVHLNVFPNIFPYV